MKIAVLTGGGDCQGLNAAIRAVVRKALEYDFDVMGVQRGWWGLLNDSVKYMNLNSVSGILPLGGTILGTSRTNPFKHPNGPDIVLDNIKKNKIDVLVVIGGDDTLGVAVKLFKMGIPVVGIPKTMDNDVAFTDYCIGFDSAVSIVCDALDKLHTTASAHHRVMVVEVMGRDTGWVALVGGLAGGADWILIPEVPTNVSQICDHLNRRRSRRKEFSIIVVAEGVTFPDLDERELSDIDEFGHPRLDRRNIGELLGRLIEKRTGFETRVTVLGHLQRGGAPTVFDRVLATRLGVAAVNLVKDQKFGRMVALQGNEIKSVELEDAINNSPKGVNIELYRLAQLFY